MEKTAIAGKIIFFIVFSLNKSMLSLKRKKTTKKSTSRPVQTGHRKKKQMKKIAIIGSTGHFGKVIYAHLKENLTDAHFYLLQRGEKKGNDPRETPILFDFQKMDTLPRFPETPDLLVDLSGPTESNDGTVLAMAFRAKIPYMDIALHNSHLEKALSIARDYPEGFALVHAGLFPGLSNLLVSHLRSLSDPNAEYMLYNEFPVYAGGGHNVAESLIDLLRKRKQNYYMKDGKRVFHLLHTERKKIPGTHSDLTAYRWMLPEVPCFEHSMAIRNFDRLIRLKPGIASFFFRLLVRILSDRNEKSIFAVAFQLVKLLKTTLMQPFNPSLTMEASATDATSARHIRLNIRSGITFHGAVMLKFIEAFFKKRRDQRGVFTPESFFRLDEILPFGEYETYSMEFVEKESTAPSKR